MTEPTIVPKGPVVDALQTQWRRLRSLADDLDDAQWARPSVLPGWSVGAVFAHIVGTESMLAGRSAPDVDLSDADHVHNPIGELNEQWLRHLPTQSRERLLAAFDEIIDVRTAALAGMSTDDFDALSATPAGRDTYGRFMRIRVFDCWMHEIDVRDTLKLAAVDDPQPAALAVDEIVASLPFVIGKRAGAAPGTLVRVELSGLAARSIAIEVTDRARLAPSAEPSAADLTLRTDTVDLARLVGGRVTADPSAITAHGDEALAARIVGALDYVI